MSAIWEDIAYTRCCYQQSFAATVRPHAHEVWELLWIRGGNARLMIEGEKYSLSPNDLCIVPPAQIHRVAMMGGNSLKYVSLACDIDRILPEFTDQFQENTVILNFSKNREDYSVLEQMDSIFSSGEKNAYESMRALLRDELLPLMIKMSWTQERSKPLAFDLLVRNAVQYIHENITTLKRVQELYEPLGFSKNRLYDLFIQYMLIPPQKYIQIKRVTLARIAVRNGEDLKSVRRKYRIKDQNMLEGQPIYPTDK